MPLHPRYPSWRPLSRQEHSAHPVNSQCTVSGIRHLISSPLLVFLYSNVILTLIKKKVGPASPVEQSSSVPISSRQLGEQDIAMAGVAMNHSTRNVTSSRTDIGMRAAPSTCRLTGYTGPSNAARRWSLGRTTCPTA